MILSGPSGNLGPEPALMLQIKELADAHEVSFFDALVAGMRAGYFILDPKRVALYGSQ